MVLKPLCLHFSKLQRQNSTKYMWPTPPAKPPGKNQWGLIPSLNNSICEIRQPLQFLMKNPKTAYLILLYFTRKLCGTWRRAHHTKHLYLPQCPRHTDIQLPDLSSTLVHCNRLSFKGHELRHTQHFCQGRRWEQANTLIALQQSIL